jgi:outer membrane protein OmpA-like peptidoglycan-associated protein
MEPVKRDPHESAIQGPKTMPALPTQSVDQQQTFEAKDAPKEETTILERHQQEALKEKREEIKPVVPAPKANVAPASFDKSGQEALKKTIPFQQGQIGLSSDQIDPLAAAVVKQLDAREREEWRVQIRAYATPYGTGVSSDRRIALSRALSLRSALIAQGVPAARIDVLAEGLQSDNPKQPDRIDLYMYGPEAK